MPQNSSIPPLGFFDRFRAIPQHMRGPIYDHFEQGETPLEVHRWLTGPTFTDPPSLRTVERAYAAFRETDNGSGAWSVVTATDAEEARLGLRILAAVVQETKHRRLEVSQRAMRAAVAVLRAREDLDPWQAYLIGRAYLSRPPQDRPTYDLDLYLADPDLYQRVIADVSSFTEWPPRRRKEQTK